MSCWGDESVESHWVDSAERVVEGERDIGAEEGGNRSDYVRIGVLGSVVVGEGRRGEMGYVAE